MAVCRIYWPLHCVLFPFRQLNTLFRTEDAPNDAILILKDFCYGTIEAGMGDIHAFSPLL